ncbi:protein CMSS1 isoform X1 [Gavia stellata]|uniref:protein CMSS1 isoform X1 n=1 Tax=Gavia stellata TaxID=37040 RepID=UPI002896ED01|nr:protein CMSS1 isoform X1 [Gavia stellata]
MLLCTKRGSKGTGLQRKRTEKQSTICLQQMNVDPSDDEAIEKASDNRTATHQDSDSKPAVTKKRKQPTECFLSQPEEKQESTVKAKRRKKKKISDILEKSAPKPGVPADLQNLLSQHFGENRSVIEIEELKLSDSCFLPANDLTHSFSSYLKEICPKWAKLRKNHNEKKSVVMLVICSSALRSLELIKSMTAFKGDCRVLKLFAKHIKIKEQVNMLEKGVFHIGVGTPGRVKALVEQDGLCLNSTKYMILDWNWRDQKLRRMMDIPEMVVLPVPGKSLSKRTLCKSFLKNELKLWRSIYLPLYESKIKKETIDLLEMCIIKLCREGSVKLGLF